MAYEAEAKRGDQRRALAVEPCFVPLRVWGLSRWQGTQLALALDATTLGTRFTVLAISPGRRERPATQRADSMQKNVR